MAVAIISSCNYICSCFVSFLFFEHSNFIKTFNKAASVIIEKRWPRTEMIGFANFQSIWNSGLKSFDFSILPLNYSMGWFMSHVNVWANNVPLLLSLTAHPLNEFKCKHVRKSFFTSQTNSWNSNCSVQYKFYINN